MGTNMMPQQPPTPDSPAEAGGYPPAFAKAADQASTALATMFKICHQQEPDSPLCDALQNMIKAVAEIEARAGMGPGGDPESAAEDTAEGPMGEQVEGEAPPQDVPMSGNPAFAQAANEAVNMMQAKKRPPGA